MVATPRTGAQDTLRVRADGKPRWGDPVRLVEELSIGQADGPPEYAFGRLQRLAVEPGGAFYTFDESDNQIRRYDAKGKFLGLIGRKGSGPGEYGTVAAMAVTGDSGLLVYDVSNLRLTYFRRDGSVLRSLPASRAGFYGDGFILDEAGRVYLLVSVPGGPAEGEGSRQQFLRYRGATLVDSLPIPPGSSQRNIFYLSTSDGMRWNFIDQAIHAPYALGGVISGTAGRYRFVVDTGGPRVLAVERSVSAVPVASEERAQWLAFGEFLTRTRGSGRTYDVPRAKPYMRSVTSDHLGRIWVEVFVAAERRSNIPPRPPDRGPLVTWRERTTYDVFSPAGAYLGRVSLPAESVLMAVRDDRIWTRTRGPDGEDRIVVFRIQAR